MLRFAPLHARFGHSKVPHIAARSPLLAFVGLSVRVEWHSSRGQVTCFRPGSIGPSDRPAFVPAQALPLLMKANESYWTKVQYAPPLALPTLRACDCWF